MCKLRAADFNRFRPTRTITIKNQARNDRKESTRRAARGAGGPAAQRHGAAAAASGARGAAPGSDVVELRQSRDRRSARRAYTDSTLYGAGGVTEGDRGEGKGKPMYVVPPSPRARAQA